MDQQEYDNVNHPRHYNMGKYEVIDVIEDWGLNLHLGNAVKYIARAGYKPGDPLEDLKKGRWYLDRFINLLERDRENVRNGNQSFGASSEEARFRATLPQS